MWLSADRADRAARAVQAVRTYPVVPERHPSLTRINFVVATVYTWSGTELALLGALLAKDLNVRTAQVPAPQPVHAWMGVAREQLRATYATVALDSEQQRGLAASEHALIAAFLKPWLDPSDYELLSGPFDRVRGTQTGYLDGSPALATFMLQVNGLNDDEGRAVAEAFYGISPHRAEAWGAQIAGAASLSCRLSPLLHATDALGMLVASHHDLDPHTRTALHHAAAVQAGSMLMTDLLPADLETGIRDVWSGTLQRLRTA